MTVLLISPEMKPSSWIKHIQSLAPDIDVRVWPEAGHVEDISMVLVWKHPRGILNRFPNLKCIASLGVGIDHVLSDDHLPDGVPITRIIEPSMAQSMSEYVTLAVLIHCRHFGSYNRDQDQKIWQPRVPLVADKIRIGVLGLGQLGAHAAAMLSRLGFAVAGWSRSHKKIDQVDSFVGNDELEGFLKRTDILICMLPLTPSTEGILCRNTFSQLPRDAYLINVARGQHLVEKDLLAALDEGHLSGACLDVFCEEPLPEAHPFWAHPKITVTPHISSLTYPAAVAPQLVENYRRLDRGEALMNVVDPTRGY